MDYGVLLLWLSYRMILARNMRRFRARSVSSLNCVRSIHPRCRDNEPIMHKSTAIIAGPGVTVATFVLVAGVFTVPQLLRSGRTPTPPEESGVKTPSRSKLVSGAATVALDGHFSFAAAGRVSRGGDIQFVGFPKFGLSTPGGILPLGYDDLNRIETVPRQSSSLLGSNYRGGAEFLVGQCYAVFCADRRHYAKIRATGVEFESGAPHISFEWVYQSDGTPNFARPDRDYMSGAVAGTQSAADASLQ